ncbi:hypothetical protein [Actinomadura atramentaria]|uniref:hypothetical protein n=1 Tax=Actinomadura atramentaria TaxID=1990 RepID=UPI00036A282F|nr:hypothetical protein [Actinomadura atramentaria]
MSRLLPRTLALAAAPVALAAVAALPAHAATTTWTTYNPSADDKFTATSTGPLTLKNAAGQTLVSCDSLKEWGSMTSATPPAGWALAALTSRQGINCVGPGGASATVLSGTFVSENVSVVGRSYNAATKTATLSIEGSTWGNGLVIISQNCSFAVSKTNATYANDTQTLKYTTGTAKLSVNANGPNGCPTLLKTEGESITFNTELKVSPAIRITATTS